MSTEPEKKTRTEEAVKADPVVNLVTEPKNSESLTPSLLSRPVAPERDSASASSSPRPNESTSTHSFVSSYEYGYSDSLAFASTHPYLQQAPTSNYSKFEFKQLANGVYFGAGAIAMLEVAMNWNLPHMLPMVALFSLCAIAGFFFATALTPR